MTVMPAEEFAWPGYFEYAKRYGLSDAGHIVLFAGDEAVGSIGFGLGDGRKLRPSDKPFIEGVAKQAAVAIRMLDLAEQARQAAVSLERETAAQRRATEMSKSNEELEVRNRLLSVVAEISTLLAQTGDFTENLRNALAMIGQEGPFSRVLILEERQRTSPNSGSDHYVTVEWCAPGIETHIERDATIFSSEVAEQFLIKLRSGEAFWCPIEDVEYPMRTTFERLGVKATGCAPLFVDAEYWGTISFDDCVRLDPWSSAQVDAFKVVAQAISNAIQTRRSAERLASERERSAKERAKELIEINSQLRDNLLTLSEGGDSQKTLKHILLSALQQLQASGACVFSFDEVLQTLQLTASADRDAGMHNPFQDQLGRCADPFPANSLPLWSRFIATREAVPVDVRNLAEAALLRAGATEWHLNHGRPIILAVPLVVANRILGYLSFTFGPSYTTMMISADQIRMAQSLASLAAMTIETDRLARRAQDAAIAEDRNRLAHELHDTLAGAFTGIFMQLQAASDLPDSKREQRQACLGRAEDLARNGLRQVREFVHTLTINGEERWKTVGVMRKIVSDATAGTEVDGTFSVQGTEQLLKASVSHALQRILQEAVGNAQRYANATKIEAALLFEEESVRLTISDDGAGFDVGSATDSGFGIPGMRTRVTRLAGTFSLDSREGHGTTITVRLPEPYEVALQ